MLAASVYTQDLCFGLLPTLQTVEESIIPLSPLFPIKPVVVQIIGRNSGNPSSVWISPVLPRKPLRQYISHQVWGLAQNLTESVYSLGSNLRSSQFAYCAKWDVRKSEDISNKIALVTIPWCSRANNFPAPSRPRRTIIKIDQNPLLKLPSTYCQKSNRYEHLVCHVKTPL